MASSLRDGDVVYLIGEIGAGKTTFARHLCRALGVTEPVTSPTFAIAHRYERPGGVVAHLDLYRAERALTPPEIADLAPYVDDPQAITIVEWPDAGDGLLTGASVRVSIAFDGAGRAISVERLPAS